MKQINKFIKFHSLALGLILMFVITWSIELAQSGFMGFSVPYGVYLFLGWGFVFGAILITLLAQGRTGLIELLKRYLIWRVGWKWYGFAFLLYPTIYLAAILISTWITGVAIDFTEVYALRLFEKPDQLWLFILPFFLVDLISNGEEIGWRGFVLPRLQFKYSPLAASIILGVIWGLWHLPKHLASWDIQAYGLFMIRIIGDAVLYTWLFNHTRGSLLLTSIFHAMQNTAGVFLPIGGTTRIVIAGLTWVVALAALLISSQKSFEPDKLSQPRPVSSDVGQ